MRRFKGGISDMSAGGKGTQPTDVKAEGPVRSPVVFSSARRAWATATMTTPTPTPSSSDIATHWLYEDTREFYLFISALIFYSSTLAFFFFFFF